MHHLEIVVGADRLEEDDLPSVLRNVALLRRGLVVVHPHQSTPHDLLVPPHHPVLGRVVPQRSIVLEFDAERTFAGEVLA